jgi:hypothetical protein
MVVVHQDIDLRQPLGPESTEFHRCHETVG